MRGGHDLGGMHGLGPVNPEPESEEPWFHADWEKRAFGMTLALASLGLWNIDKSRHARERQNPADYIRNSYYENWMSGIETMLKEEGVVTQEELVEGKSHAPAPNGLVAKKLAPEAVAAVLAKGGPADMPAEDAPHFRKGDTVRVLVRNPSSHIRAPSYTMGRTGLIDAYHGCHIIPDLHAIGQKQGGHLYNVRFEAEALWGPDATGRHPVYVDLWQSYLAAA